MPDTAMLYGVTRKELFDEDINIQVGLHYLKNQLHRFENRNLAIAAYNCGPQRIVDAGYKIPKIQETINYVRRVNHAAKKYGSKKLQYQTKLFH